MDSYGNGKGNHWIPMDSYQNDMEIVGFLWMPMEIVRKSLDSYGFLWNW